MRRARLATVWPNGVNFNRSFPGDPDGPADQQLAHFFSTVLFPLADVVVVDGRIAEEWVVTDLAERLLLARKTASPR